MRQVLTPDDVVAAAVAVEAALRPVAGRDWSAQAGPLGWDVEQTITHMLGATAKYTLYLASRCQHFIGLTVQRWPDATNDEVIDSVVPNSWCTPTTPSAVSASRSSRPRTCAGECWRSSTPTSPHRAAAGKACWRPPA